MVLFVLFNTEKGWDIHKKGIFNFLFLVHIWISAFYLKFIMMPHFLSSRPSLSQVLATSMQVHYLSMGKEFGGKDNNHAVECGGWCGQPTDSLSIESKWERQSTDITDLMQHPCCVSDQNRLDLRKHHVSSSLNVTTYNAIHFCTFTIFLSYTK